MEILLAALDDEWLTQLYIACTAVAMLWCVRAGRI
jgi:hypothetical protein